MAQDHDHNMIRDFFSAESTPKADEAFEAWLREDHANIKTLAEFVMLDGLLLNTQKNADAQAILASLLDAEENAPLHLVDLTPGQDPIQDLGRLDHEPISFRQLLGVVGYMAAKGLRQPTFIKTTIAAVLLLSAALILVLTLSGPKQQDAVQSNGLAANTPGQPDTTPQSSTVATLTATQNATWVEGALAPGSRLNANQRLTLTAGFAEITTNRGAIAILEAPATIELLDNDNAVRLHAGKLVGICETEPSKGFLVRTPHMDITDLGTRFGVDVIPYRQTEVHVHQGEVTVSQPATDATPNPIQQHITENRAVRSSGKQNAIAAITPDFARFDPALSVYRLRGTGYSIAEGAVDPAWQIVADANGPLDKPLPLFVQFSEDTHYPAVGNDPERAQWLFFAIGFNAKYYPFHPPDGIDSTRLTFENQFSLPDKLDLEGKVLYLRYGSNEGLDELRINGQAIEPLPKNAGKSGEILFNEVEVPIHQTTLQPGDNRICIDVPNRVATAAANIYFYWEVRPATNATTLQGETQP